MILENYFEVYSGAPKKIRDIRRMDTVIRKKKIYFGKLRLRKIHDYSPEYPRFYNA